MSIGATIVANNVGPAVGSQGHHACSLGRSLSLLFARQVGRFWQAAMLLIQVKPGIIDPKNISDSQVFLFVMLATLIAGAIWVHLAMIFQRAPVSTTHSIVGGVLGARSRCWWIWRGKLVGAWDNRFKLVLSPVLGGIIAVLFLLFIKRTITYKQDKKEAARKIVPILIFVMVWAFGIYLMLKGFSKLYSFSAWQAIGIAFVIAVVS